MFEARGASMALELLNAEPIGLLFTDVVMAGELDGIELAPMARERWPNVKVLLTSGFSPVQVTGENSNAFPLLSKPYAKEELARAIRAILDGRPSPLTEALWWRKVTPEFWV